MAENTDANILFTYGDVSRKDDVLPLIEILTASDNTLMNLLGTTTATDMVHINMTDTLDTAASSAVREGESLVGRALTTPARVSNVVEVIAKTYVVTDAQKMIQHWHSEDELSRQRTKGLTDWGNSCEFDLMRSTLVSGVSGTIPKMSYLTIFLLFVKLNLIRIKKILCKLNVLFAGQNFTASLAI